MASNSTLLDGDYTSATPVGARKYQYPFRMNGDNISAFFDEDNWQVVDSYSPQPFSIPHSTLRDFYLIAETQPVPSIANLLNFTRTWSRIPSAQTVPTSLQISKPAIAGTFPQAIGSYRVFQPDTTLLKYDAYTAQTVVSDSGAPGATAFYPTGGTYTITFAGYTTAAIAYNAAAATVQTALNALTSVSNRGNVVVTGTYNSVGGFTITFNVYAVGSANTGSLVASTGASIVSSMVTGSGGYSQLLNIYATGLDAGTPAIDISGLYVTGSAMGFSALQSGQDFFFNVVGYGTITGGTYTLTIFGQTTNTPAIVCDPSNSNASVAAATAAILGALTNLTSRGAVTVIGTFTPNSIFIHVNVAPVVSSGTYTVTMFGDTTSALNYNASNATILAAVNALAGVTARGGCVLVGAGFGTGFSPYVGITFSLIFANAGLSYNNSSLTPSPSNIASTITDGTVGRIQTLSFSAMSAVRTISAPLHGLTASNTLFLKTDATYVIFTGQFSVPDANTIILSPVSGTTPASAIAITEVGKRTKQGYKPGTTSIRANIVTNFYLPGVTTGITTTADIPLPTLQSDDASFLQAVFAGSGTINYIVGQWVRWMNSPIISQDTTQIAAADV
jgi:hypothetical protein